MRIRLRDSILATFVVIAAALLPGCPGSGCRYDEIDGSCEVTHWEGAAAAEGGESSDRFDVSFDFIPAGATDATVTDRRLSLGDGSYLACRAWLDEVGLTEGSQHGCVLMEATAGACSPIVFRFNDFDETSVHDACRF